MRIKPIKLNKKKKQSDIYQVSYRELSAMVRRAARYGYNMNLNPDREEIDILIENGDSYLHLDSDYTKKGPMSDEIPWIVNL